MNLKLSIKCLPKFSKARQSHYIFKTNLKSHCAMSIVAVCLINFLSKQFLYSSLHFKGFLWIVIKVQFALTASHFCSLSSICFVPTTPKMELTYVSRKKEGFKLWWKIILIQVLIIIKNMDFKLLEVWYMPFYRFNSLIPGQNLSGPWPANNPISN